MSVYMEIANAIDPQSALQTGFSRASSSEYRLDQKKLVAKIDQVLERYGLDKHLLDSSVEPETMPEAAGLVRCKHV
jgi:hypothetical protein